MDGSFWISYDRHHSGTQPEVEWEPQSHGPRCAPILLSDAPDAAPFEPFLLTHNGLCEYIAVHTAALPELLEATAGPLARMKDESEVRAAERVAEQQKEPQIYWTLYKRIESLQNSLEEAGKKTGASSSSMADLNGGKTRASTSSPSQQNLEESDPPYPAWSASTSESIRKAWVAPVRGPLRGLPLTPTRMALARQATSPAPAVGSLLRNELPLFTPSPKSEKGGCNETDGSPSPSRSKNALKQGGEHLAPSHGQNPGPTAVTLWHTIQQQQQSGYEDRPSFAYAGEDPLQSFSVRSPRVPIDTKNQARPDLIRKQCSNKQVPTATFGAEEDEDEEPVAEGNEQRNAVDRAVEPITTPSAFRIPPKSQA